MKTVLQVIIAIGMTGVLAGAETPRASTATTKGAGAITQRAGDTSQPDLSSLISDPRTLSVVRCELENARWGAYDTRIYVEKTNDGNSYVLDLRKGRVSTRRVTERPAWVLGPWSLWEDRDGKVVFGSAKEAFDKAVPFYISAEFQPPDILRVIVVSNPHKSIDRATLFTGWDSPSGAGTMKDSGHVHSADQPQTLVVRADGFKDTAAIDVWIRQGEVDRDNPFADMPHCLISNEVEVKK